MTEDEARALYLMMDSSPSAFFDLLGRLGLELWVKAMKEGNGSGFKHYADVYTRLHNLNALPDSDVDTNDMRDVWITRRGKHLRLRDMKDEHLCYTWRFVKTRMVANTRNDWLSRVELELEARGIDPCQYIASSDEVEL